MLYIVNIVVSQQRGFEKTTRWLHYIIFNDVGCIYDPPEHVTSVSRVQSFLPLVSYLVNLISQH